MLFLGYPKGLDCQIPVATVFTRWLRSEERVPLARATTSIFEPLFNLRKEINVLAVSTSSSFIKSMMR
jgi:hypothetical protein